MAESVRTQLEQSILGRRGLANLEAGDKLEVVSRESDLPAALRRGFLAGRLAASWSENRLDSILSRYAEGSNSDRTRALATHIDPRKFLQLTTPDDRYQRVIEQETGHLDPAVLAAERLEITLDVDGDPATGQLKVVGHEGRHRMAALARAGVTRVPVTLYTGFRPQAMGHEPLGLTLAAEHSGRGVALVTAVPLTVANREVVANKFGRADTDVRFMTAWHGTPHQFEQFSLERAGTGYKGEAFGHGLYFSSSRDVAEWYRDKLTIGQHLVLDGEMIKLADLRERLFAELQQGFPEALARRAALAFVGAIEHDRYPADEAAGRSSWGNQALRDQLLDYAGRITRPVPVAGPERPGVTYEVEIAPAESDFMLWDEPLEQQPVGVREKLLAARAEIEERFGPAADFFDKGQGASTLYWDMEDAVSSEDASRYLLSLGIRGVKYHEKAVSSQGAHNYVVFSESDIEIRAKHSLAGGRVIVGAYHHGKAWMVEETMAESGVRLDQVARHELLHMLLSEDTDFRKFRGGLLGRFEELRDSGSRPVVAAYAMVPRDTPPADRTEEAWAYFVQEPGNRRHSLVRRLVSGVKAWLYRHRIPIHKLGRVGKLDETDFIALAEQGIKKMVATKPTDTPAFKRWFGKSKIVDEKGEPLVVYHGTGVDFDRFKKSRKRPGLHFHFDPDLAEQYARYPGPRILPVYVRAEKIFDWRKPEHHEIALAALREAKNFEPWMIRELEKGDWEMLEHPAVQKAIRAAGCDAWYSNDHPGVGIAVFKPTQVKSVFNKGTFSPRDSRISYSVAGPPAGGNSLVERLKQSGRATAGPGPERPKSKPSSMRMG